MTCPSTHGHSSWAPGTVFHADSDDFECGICHVRFARHHAFSGWTGVRVKGWRGWLLGKTEAKRVSCCQEIPDWMEVV